MAKIPCPVCTTPTRTKRFGSLKGTFVNHQRDTGRTQMCRAVLNRELEPSLRDPRTGRDGIGIPAYELPIYETCPGSATLAAAPRRLSPEEALALH